MTTPAMPQDNAANKPVIGVLLVHGFNGSRRDFAAMETYLQSLGLITNNMLLPGHGVRIRDFIRTGWAEWEAAVRSELADLKQRCDIVFLVGHSLGGALVLHVAAHEEVAGVVSMCPPLHMHPFTGFFVKLARRITPLLPTLREDVRDPEGRRLYGRDGYRWTPMLPVESLLQFLPHLRDELPRITVPALVMVSVHDHVVPARDGREVYRLLGSREKYLVTFHRSYHVIMKDHDRAEVFAKTAAFITRQAANAKPHSKTISTPFSA